LAVSLSTYSLPIGTPADSRCLIRSLLHATPSPPLRAALTQTSSPYPYPEPRRRRCVCWAPCRRWCAGCARTRPSPRGSRRCRCAQHRCRDPQVANRNARVWPRGDREWPLNDRQIPNFLRVRVALGTGYNPAQGNRRARRNGRVSDLPAETPPVTIRNLLIAARAGRSPPTHTRARGRLLWCEITSSWGCTPAQLLHRACCGSKLSVTAALAVHALPALPAALVRPRPILRCKSGES
jgi:hypothetical protein